MQRIKSIYRTERLQELMMKYFFTIATVLQFLAIRNSVGLPNGAPSQACPSLKPNHGIGPKDGISPFNITAQKVGPNQLEVTISSPNNTTFKGFILQAREVGGTTPLGEFSNAPSHAKTIKCIDDHVGSADTRFHTNVLRAQLFSYNSVPYFLGYRYAQWCYHKN